jgi:YVTN family beta-propeller protein
VGAPIPVGSGPFGVAITPDGKHVYVANRESVPGTVSVIDTGSNIVVAGPPTPTPFTVGNGPIGVGITPPVQFRALSATLDIHFGGAPNQDTFNWHSQFTLSSTASNGINPVTEPVTLQVGTFGTTIPPGSFTKNRNGSFTFVGVIGGVSLNALIKPTGTLRYAFHTAATGASLTGTKNPVQVTLTIGDDRGLTSVRARIR